MAVDIPAAIPHPHRMVEDDKKNTHMKKALLYFSILTAILASSCSQKNIIVLDTQQPTVVKNVIFVVGDGMGTAQVYASIVAKRDSSQFLKFPYSGFSRTYSNNRYKTDSGAGGTALMTGHKVDNYHIALSSDNIPYPSFLVTAHEQLGKSAGFVVSSGMLDATPATTYGHASDRKMTDLLSIQMAQCPFEVMVGGGKNQFLPENRKDGLAPIDTLVSRGYTMVYSLNDLKHCTSQKICAFLSDENYASGNAEKRDYWLVAGTRKAIEVLNSNPNGFTLMVEASQIDWALHNTDSAYLLTELDELERTLAVILDFAERDGNTLVIVTADHETGGLSLPKGDIDAGVSNFKFQSGDHTGVMVPVFSYGPGAEQFSGIQQNSDFYYKILNLLNH